jgi:spore coat polysaccharide biosynthesis protein SpsF (cytidylyltransferase family)
MINVFIQARMSSARFPGKVLAPFKGEPIVARVMRSVTRVNGINTAFVVTSTERSDDPVAAFAQMEGWNLFRGPLQDVHGRFRQCILQHPADWILRVNADSPLLSPTILQLVVNHAADEGVDLVTTTFPRTFPVGQNAELIRVDTFLNLPSDEMTTEDREHVTRYFYRHPGRFRIVNVESGCPELAKMKLAVDSIEDLSRLEQYSDEDIENLLK